MKIWLWFIILCLVSTVRGAGIIEFQGQPHIMFTTPTLELAPCVQQTIPENGLRWERLTDVALTKNTQSPNPWNYDGNPGAGIVNNYSRSYTGNLTDEWTLGFSNTPLACIFDSNFLFKGLVASAIDSTHKVGDSQELKWSDDAATPYLFYYFPNAGRTYYLQDIRVGVSSEKIVAVIPAALHPTADGSPSQGLVAESCVDGTVRVIEIKNGRIKSGWIAYKNPNGVDVSPDGRWVKVDNYFYPMDGFDTAATVTLASSISPGHGAFGIDTNGASVYVWQSTSTDWISKYNMQTGVTTKLFYMGEFGGSWPGIHISINRNPALAGYVIVSTYSSRYAAWGRNEVFALALGGVEKKAPIKRIGRMNNFWIGPPATDPNGKGNFYTEGYASESYSGDYIYYGGNFFLKDNLELYRIHIPMHYFDDLLAVAGGIPVPTPNPTVTPVPLNEFIPFGVTKLITGPAQVYYSTPTPAPVLQSIEALGSAYFYASKASLGDTTTNNYTLFCKFDQLQQATSTRIDTGMLLQFNIPALSANSKVSLVLTHHPNTEYGGHPTGREGIPVRKITGGVFTPAYIRYPLKTGEDMFDGASWYNRLQTPSTTQAWSTLPSAALGVYAQHTGDLSTVLEPITNSTPRLNFATSGITSSVDITAYCKTPGLLQIALDTTNASSPDVFGKSDGSNVVYRVRQAVYGAGAIDVKTRPRLVISN